MVSHKTRDTSVKAYIQNLEKLGKRYKEIILILRKYDMPMNNQMILREMRRTYPQIEISSICSRTNELRKSKTKSRDFPILIIVGQSICPITGKETDFIKLNQGIRDILQ